MSVRFPDPRRREEAEAEEEDDEEGTVFALSLPPLLGSAAAKPSGPGALVGACLAAPSIMPFADEDDEVLRPLYPTLTSV